ncbi:MAG: hypothetical protein ACLFP2_00515 [Candidatus Woesearchaeota archaeon]
MYFELIHKVFAIVMVLLVIFGFYNTIFASDSLNHEDKMCRSSVKTMELMHIKGAQLEPQELKCPTKEVEIDAKKDSDIKKAIADEMVTCWDNFLRGKPEIFEKRQVYCSVCSILSFKEEKEIDGFSTYLAQTKYNDTITYMDYLMNYESSLAHKYIENQNAKQIDDKVIDTAKDYSIVFVYAKGTSTIENWINTLGKKQTTAIIGIGTGAGAAAVTGYVLVTVVTGGVGLVTIAISGAVGLIAGATSAIKTYLGGEEAHLAMVLLREHTGESFKELQCDYFPSKQGD